MIHLFCFFFKDIAPKKTPLFLIKRSHFDQKFNNFQFPPPPEKTPPPFFAISGRAILQGGDASPKNFFAKISKNPVHTPDLVIQ